AIGIPTVNVSGSAKRIVLTGSVADTNASVTAEQVARAFAGEVDNLLQTPYPLLVNVDVAIAEIDRTNLRNLGFSFPILADVSVTQTATGTQTGIEFKDFGVLIDIIPNADPSGVVTMRVRSEVSQPDFTIGFTPFAGASIIPGFTRRSAISEVTVQPGGTIAV